MAAPLARPHTVNTLFIVQPLPAPILRVRVEPVHVIEALSWGTAAKEEDPLSEAYRSVRPSWRGLLFPTDCMRLEHWTRIRCIVTRPTQCDSVKEPSVIHKVDIALTTSEHEQFATDRSERRRLALYCLYLNCGLSFENFKLRHDRAQ